MTEPQFLSGLTAVLDRLVPAHDDLPGAGGLGLAPAVAAGLVDDRSADGRAQTVVEFAGSFAAIEVERQEGFLSALEHDSPAAFQLLVDLCYGAYYTDSRVLAWLERHTGYPARPPQPEGYALEPFDEAILGAVKRLPRRYRLV